MTDQRDTPDTRTPSAEGCDHDRHQSVRDSADASDVRWGHISGDFGVTPWEPCPEPAPLLTGHPDRSSQGLGDNRAPRGDAKGLVSDPTPVGTSDALPRSLTTGAEPTEPRCAVCGEPMEHWLTTGFGTPLYRHVIPGDGHHATAVPPEPTAPPPAPTEETADRDALVERLRHLGSPEGAHGSVAREAADALEDLTRENERLRLDADTANRLVDATADRMIGLELAEAERDALRAQVAAQRAIALEQDPERLWLPPGNCEAAYCEGQGCSLADRFAVLDGATPGATE